MKYLAVLCGFVALGLVFSGCSQVSQSGPKTVVIGVMPFNEQYIIGEIAALLLEKEGYSTEIRSGMNNAALYDAIKAGQVDMYVDYTSTVYYQLPDREPVDRWDPGKVYAIVERGLARDGILLAGQLGFRNDNMIVVPSAWASKRNVRTVDDLAPYANEMVFGSDLVFHAAEEDGLPHVEKVYNFSFGEVRPMDPSLTFVALQSGNVDAIVAYTTDSRIALFNLTALEDNQYAMPPYHAILLVNGKRAEDKGIITSISPLIDQIDSETMRHLNSRFDIDKEDPKTIAREYLVSRGLIAT
ncbi:MAG: glycine/betaine ABC transporter substrate-binding protein [Methanolinea sp.]|jgi:osmoprotectant transport system substrate-binding protein|nr:glycine/betaine ABC transporter substrate-binding protein [Methanolinea sp.]